MPFVYFGKRHNLIGKSLWEIIGCLKNFGVGRMVIKNRNNHYPEPCFMRIVSAKPKMDNENLEGELYVEKIFRGINKGVVVISRVAYKPDYSLIPKHEEHKYIKAYEEFKLQDIKIFAPTAEMPPLLKLVAEQKGHHATVFPMSFKTADNPRTRAAREGETPNAVASPSLGTPVCRRLYEGVLDNEPN